MKYTHVHTSTAARIAVGWSILATVAMLSTVTAYAQGAVYFRDGFEGAAPRYGFGYAYPASSGRFQSEKLSSGGFNGGGAGHLRTLAGAEQYALGWSTPQLGRSFATGDGVYVRFRIRYDDDHRWVGNGSLQNKFLMMGNADAPTQSRFIIHSEKPHDTTGCSLGFNGDGRGSRWLPRDFGLNHNSWNDSAIAGLWGSLAIKVNISWDCAPPVPVTRGIWYHVQVYAKSGNGNGQFKMWVNNNSVSSPNSQASGFTLGATDWQNGFTIGGYQTDTPTSTGGFRLDDVEIGDTFHSSWYPGGSAVTATPSPPTDVRVN